MCTHDPARPPADTIDSSVEQMQYVFHELHADGRHALCAVCGGNPQRSRTQG
jgi:hypothetical protein